MGTKTIQSIRHHSFPSFVVFSPAYFTYLREFNYELR